MTILWRPPVVVGFAGLLALMYVLAFGARVSAFGPTGLDAANLPIGGDFVAFWSAGQLAVDGQAGATFDPAIMQSAQQRAIPGSEAVFLWNYPPTFLLVVAPFTLLSPVQAVWAWWLISLPLYVGALYAVVPRRETVVVAGASSAALLAVAHGQNGFLLMASLSVGLLAVQRNRPLLAGVCFSVVCVKPHLGLLLPVALVAARLPKVVLWTAAATGAWVVASAVAFGTDAWVGFVGSLSSVQSGIDGGAFIQAKMVSPYVSALSLGMGSTLAAAIQLISVGVAVMSVAWTFAVLGVRPLSASVLLIATGLVSPYFFDYDLVLWSGAFAFAFADSSEFGKGEREVWALAAILPVCLAPLFDATEVQVGAFGSVALLVVLIQRARTEAARLSP